AVSAVSRARRRVRVTAVQDAQSAPSALFDALVDLAAPTGSEGPSEQPWLDPEALQREPGPAPDARRLDAALRRRLHEDDPARARDAPGALAALGRAGTPGPEPTRRFHQEPRPSTPTHEGDAPIRLSPSALERAVDCPQSWLMERAGGTRSGGPAQLIGTALHQLAQVHPSGPSGGEQDLLE